MTGTVVFWLMAALLLVWSLGAYNRLVRLRAQVINSFAAVDQRMVQALALLAEAVAAHDTSAALAAHDPDNTEVPDGPLRARAGLQAAAVQFEVALRVARKQALDASAVAALQAAYATAHGVWARHRLPAPELDAGVMQRAWEDNTQMVREAQAGYNTAVQVHNAAIAQFPASLLAYFFGFGPAASL